MTKLETIQRDALSLPREELLALYRTLRESLHSPVHKGESSDSVAEALRREEEWENDPSLGLTLEELKASVGR